MPGQFLGIWRSSGGQLVIIANIDVDRIFKRIEDCTTRVLVMASVLRGECKGLIIDRFHALLFWGLPVRDFFKGLSWGIWTSQI